jgi:hypothetical protein
VRHPPAGNIIKAVLMEDTAELFHEIYQEYAAEEIEIDVTRIAEGGG